MDQDNNNNKSSSSCGTSMNNDGVNAEKGSISNSNDDGGLSNELNSMNIDTSSTKKKKNTCLFCLKEVEVLQGCSRCGTARYCDKACQLKHWPVHKNSCQDSNDAEDSNEKLEMKAENHFHQGNCIYIPKAYHHY